MEITMYDNLLLLPLFQGLSKNNLTTIIEKVKFHFHTYEEGETIIRQGDDCRQLCFLMNGEVTAQITDPTHGFSITEVLEAPFKTVSIRFLAEPPVKGKMHRRPGARHRPAGTSAAGGSG